MYQNNNEPQLGLFNGAMGTVVGFYYVDNGIGINESLPFYAKGIYNPFCTSCIEASQHDYQLIDTMKKTNRVFYQMLKE